MEADKLEKAVYITKNMMVADQDLCRKMKMLSVCTCAIYLTSLTYDLNVSQTQLRENVGLSEMTIRRSLRLWIPHLYSILPPDDAIIVEAEFAVKRCNTQSRLTLGNNLFIFVQNIGSDTTGPSMDSTNHSEQ